MKKQPAKKRKAKKKHDAILSFVATYDEGVIGVRAYSMDGAMDAIREYLGMPDGFNLQDDGMTILECNADVLNLPLRKAVWIVDNET